VLILGTGFALAFPSSHVTSLQRLKWLADQKLLQPLFYSHLSQAYLLLQLPLIFTAVKSVD
jgi:hypothetical protein